MYYLGARYYDSVVKRFINADSALYHSMYGYNLFAYCYNNPVNYYDPQGTLALLIGSGIYVLAQVIKAVIAVGITIVAVAAASEIGEELSDVVQEAKDKNKTKDTPKSVDKPSQEDNETTPEKQSPSKPSKMQDEIKRGQAPKNIKSAHNPQNGKPHIHFGDGTSMNNDGSIHDAHRGTPKLTKNIKKWLKKHNWPTEINIFDK